MRTTILPIALALACAAGAQTPPQTVRVGTFHTPSVVVGFYRSPLWAERLKAKFAERETAQKANDTKAVAELESWGSSHQELAHRQVAGEAPIANILDALAPAFPEIARQARVTMVAAELPYADPSVERVDVTDLILDWLKATDTTRRIVHELRTKR